MNKYTLYIGLNVGSNYPEQQGKNTPLQIKSYAINHIDTSICSGKLAMAGIASYTLTDCIGAWKGEKERTIKIEFMVNVNEHELIRELANELKAVCYQDCIMLTHEVVSTQFI